MQERKADLEKNSPANTVEMLLRATSFRCLPDIVVLRGPKGK